jgi:hypothetical protein
MQVIEAGRPQWLFFQVDADFTTLRWSWRRRDTLLVSDIKSVFKSGSGLKIYYEVLVSRVRMSSVKDLSCPSGRDADMWATALRALMRLDVQQLGIPVRQRARLKTAFYNSVAANSSALSTGGQVVPIAWHGGW